MAQDLLKWVTPTGSLGKTPIGVNINLKIQMYDVSAPSTRCTYSVIYGSLPPGVTLSSDGTLSGIAEYSPSQAEGNVTYNFIIRGVANDGDDGSLDGNFSLTVTNIARSQLSWITKAGNLGTIPSNEYYELRLEASDVAGRPVTYKVISGNIPSGMQLLSSGILKGVPTILTATTESTLSYRFTLRASNNNGQIVDRAFSVSVTNSYGPVIQPSSASATVSKFLGYIFDGDLFEQQLYVIEPNPEAVIEWSVVNPEQNPLPPGVTLSSTGLLSGYIRPIALSGAYGPAGYDGEEIDQASGAIVQDQEYDYGPYDFNGISQDVTYSFTIRAFDGANYDIQTYTLSVLSRAGTTADATISTNNTFITVDSGKYYVPQLIDESTTLPIGRQDSYYAYKFKGYDPQGFDLTYSLVNQAGTFDARVPGVDNGFDYGGDNVFHLSGVGFDSVGLIGETPSNLPGLLLDASSGWLYGKLDPQLDAVSEFTFTLECSKTIPATEFTDSVTITSKPVVFTLIVLGDVNNNINWTSPSNLGTIYGGTVSELKVEAVSTEGKPLVYSLLDKPGYPCRLPQGLQLLPSGEISGRVSFEAFALDNYTTTFDGAELTVDRTYNFYVLVQTEDGTISNTKEFILTLGVANNEPYTNLYLKALPSYDQRKLFASVVENTEIFDPNLIYRPTDPYYGVASDIQMLFASGIKTQELDDLELAIANNHWTKSYQFGDIKTATVLDSTYKTKYEVVYIDIIDPQENANGKGPGTTLDLTHVISNPYISKDGTQHKILYPNTSSNMLQQLEDNIGYQDQSSLPAWMTSNQPGTGGAAFNPPIGYTKAVVLAYTKPGASKLIAYRLQNSGINFNNIQFTVDRYAVDDYYSTNFDKVNREFFKGRETTFDRLPKSGGDIVAQVTYGIWGVPFDQINGRPVDYINSYGGLDGTKTFQPGDTLIFVQQEKYSIVEPYDGWGTYADAWIGDNILTTPIEGYGSEPYDYYAIIPGFLEKAQGIATQNQRGGVWRIDIINNVVNLSFVKEIELNQRVRILRGGTYGGAVMYYTPIVPEGQSVPYYVVYQVAPPAVDPKTTFNGGTTRFFSFKDTYYEPGTQDKYLKFPQDGVFK